MKNIVIFASGGGSNARNILEFYRGDTSVKVSLIVSNKSDAGVLKIAEEFGVRSLLITKSDIQDSTRLLQEINQAGANLIVLAGFLWKIPEALVASFPNAIINIHPALLPKYGGKGMYGHFVHEAVYQNREKESGITIHYVNEHYDEGQIIFQAKAVIESTDLPADIERKVRALEMMHFPHIIDKVIRKK